MDSPNYLLSSNAFGNTFAIDSSGNLFIPGSQGNGFYELLVGGSKANFGGIGQQISPSVTQLFTQVAIDGANHLWSMVPSSLNGVFQEPVSLAEFAASGTALNTNGFAEGFVASSLSPIGPTTIAPDASGNVWVLSGTNPTTLTEFVGVAAPVVTPTSVAVQKQKIGKTP